MKKIALLIIVLLFPVITGFFVGQGGMMGIKSVPLGGGGGACGTGYSALTGSDTNEIKDSTGGSICCPD